LFAELARSSISSLPPNLTENFFALGSARFAGQGGWLNLRIF
jgi:hypothetical protein